MRWIIFVKTINDKQYIYHVDNYKIISGRVEFLDKKTNKLKSIDSRNCEIDEDIRKC